MNRRQFIEILGMLSIPSIGHAMNKQLLHSLAKLPNSPVMPALFLGHGSPMYAIEDSQFSRGFQAAAKKLPIPSAILCISAHWQTKGTWLTAMPKPRTIHDFGGFPQALHDVQYPAPGSPELANAARLLLADAGIEGYLDQSKWGLDHGTWSVLKHMYPQADIPVVQLSLDYYKTPAQHYSLAKQLSHLRQKGVLIVGSGNIVHNLRMLSNTGEHVIFGHDWALEADAKMKQLITNSDHRALIDYRNQGKAFQLAIPTPEHYLPLLYILALQEKNEGLNIFNDQAVEGSISMTSVALGGS